MPKIKDFLHILKIHTTTVDAYIISTGFWILAQTPHMHTEKEHDHSLSNSSQPIPCK